MKTFKDLEFSSMVHYQDGKQAIIYFDNGYGASVVCHEHSYGGKEGLYELAVLDEEGQLCYDTPVTNDVMGYLTEDEVTNLLKQIQEL